MLKCKRCHAPDELNGIGLCKHCTNFIKKDVKENKDRLERIYDLFPESMDVLDEPQKCEYLREVEEIFRNLDRYYRIGFPVGSYVMPTRKILHFLDEGGTLEKKLLAKKRRRTGITAACLAALALAFATVLIILHNNPLTGGTPGEAVSVSASMDQDQNSGMEGTGLDMGDPTGGMAETDGMAGDPESGEQGLEDGGQSTEAGEDETGDDLESAESGEVSAPQKASGGGAIVSTNNGTGGAVSFSTGGSVTVRPIG